MKVEIHIVAARFCIIGGHWKQTKHFVAEKWFHNNTFFSNPHEWDHESGGCILYFLSSHFLNF